MQRQRLGDLREVAFHTDLQGCGDAAGERENLKHIAGFEDALLFFAQMRLAAGQNAAVWVENRVGDAVLAEIQPGHYVLHRIMDIIGKQVTLRGDGNLNNEYCRMEDIRAKAIGFYRKGRTKADSVEGVKWRLYSTIWTRLYPIRRYLLFIFHPHIPARFKKRD